MAAGPYLQGLASGSRLPGADRADLIRRVAGVTGLAEDGMFRRVNLRIEHMRFFRELLRHRGRCIGRLDGRFTGYEPYYGGEKPSDDPSNVAIRGPYAAALNHHVRVDLDYSSDLPYELLTVRVEPWGNLRRVRGPSRVGLLDARRGDAAQPAPAGLRGVQLLRRATPFFAPSTPSHIWISQTSCGPTSASSTTRPAT